VKTAIALVCAGTVLLAGCTGEMTRPVPGYVDDKELQALESAYNAKTEVDSQKVACSNKPPIGSRIPKTVCRTKEDAALEEREAERMIEKPRPSHHVDCLRCS
jgi:hypothetical protein